MTSPALHPDIAHLAPLLGVWRGPGHGEYPTIESFDYLEEVTFGHVGKPFLASGQKTRHAVTDLPLHAEAGYWRAPTADRIELVLAHPTGIVEVQEGSIVTTDSGLIIELSSTTMAGTGSAVSVSALTRRLELEGDTLRYRVSMAAVGVELTHHLAAELQRQT